MSLDTPAELLKPGYSIRFFEAGSGITATRKRSIWAEVVWDLHEPLISHGEFRHMRLKLEENRRPLGQSNTNRDPKLLTGLVLVSELREETEPMRAAGTIPQWFAPPGAASADTRAPTKA